MQISNTNQDVQAANEILYHPPGNVTTSGNTPPCLSYN